MIQLKVLKGPQKLGEEFDLKTGKSIVLGRGTHCDIQLLAFGVSKQHCKLTALPGGRLELEDLGSSNGTYVNGVQVHKHVVRPGDSVGLSDFVFSINWKPDLVPAIQNQAFTGIPQARGDDDGVVATAAAVKLASGKAKGGLEQTFASWIDPLAEVFPIHKLLFLGFALWTLMTVVLSIVPFSKEANVRIQQNSINIARLYARQLARLNQKAVIDQRFADLVAVLDERAGITPGIIKSYILDGDREKIMAPASEAGNILPSAEAKTASLQEREWWSYDPSRNLAYVSAPILVAGSEGKNIAAATAFVIFDPSGDIFSIANILENALTSLIILLGFTLVAAFVYSRFILHPIQQMSQSLERSVISGVPFEKPKVAWPELRDIAEKIGTIVSRLPQSGKSSEAPEDWNILMVQSIGLSAAAFDSSLKILAWNDEMAQITGVRQEYAVGSDIGVASRDMAFEQSVRSLADLAQQNPWSSQNKTLEFQGISFVMSMIYGTESYCLLIRKEDIA